MVKIINETEIKNLEDKTVAFVSFVGNYIGNAEIFKNLFEKLCGWAGPKGLLNNPEFIAAYHDDPHTTPPEELTLNLCMVVPENTEGIDEVKIKTLPGGEYAVARFELDGPQEYGPAWNLVVEWLKENNKEIDISRPCYELYLNNPEEHPEKHHILDICMAVK